jgi:glycosyltransferase involved in cell wall biosynthesis
VTAAPRISVALGTHNGARYLEQQLRSILDQTRPVDQLVVSDDGSTDETPAIVERIVGSASGAPELVMLRNPQALGVTANFEQAIAACDGDLIALSDQDDVWHPERIADAVGLFAERPSLLATHSDARLVDSEGRPLGVSLLDALEVSAESRRGIHDGDAFGIFLRRNLATGATMTLSKELLSLARPFPEAWVHDEWLAIIAAAFGGLDLIDRELIDYRQHGANVIGMGKPTLRKKLRRVFEPRGDRNSLLARRAAQLAERLDAFGASSELVAAAAGKSAHEQFRSSLPAPRWRRLPAIAREARAGGYDRYASRGKADIIRDAVQPR